MGGPVGGLRVRWGLSRYDIDDVRTRDPERIERLARWLDPLLEAVFRPEVRGLERLPEGAALLVGNHNGGMLSPDTFVLGCALYRGSGMEHLPHGLGHDVVVQAPVFHQLLAPMGVLRARHDNARRAFEAGRKVLVYPGGDVEAMRPSSQRNRVTFGGRTGYVRLAMRSGVPIVPVVAAGAHSTMLVLTSGQRTARLLGMHRLLRIKVWPVALSVPWGVTLGPIPPHVPLPTRIFMEVLEPIPVEGDPGDDAAVAHIDTEVRSRMQAALDRLSAERRARGRWPWSRA